MSNQIKFKSLLLALSMIFVASCTEKDKSSVSVTADYLHITGTAILSVGTPASYANIYIPGINAPISATDESGKFSLTISDNTLLRANKIWRERLTSEVKLFNLIFAQNEQNGSPSFVGMTAALRYKDRGSKEIGIVTLGRPASVSGVVNHLTDDGDIIPAGNAMVYAANKETITGEDGRFELTGLPATTLKIIAAGDELSSAQTITKLTINQLTNLDAPLVIFSKHNVSGWVTPLTSQPVKTLFAAGHPFQRSFSVSHSPNVKFFRYHHNREEFDAVKGSSDWQSIQNRIDYDFPGNGGHSIYIQFSDAAKKIKSHIQTIQATVNTFGNTAQVIIGDGSGEINNRNASLTITVPATAIKMRLASRSDSLKNSAWVPVKSVVEYIFPKVKDPASAMAEVYLQFADAQNNESLVYSASAILKLFPADNMPVVLIENGAETTPNREVRLDIQVPANAYQMAVSESPITSSGGGSNSNNMNRMFGGNMGGMGGNSNGKFTWYAAQEEFYFTFNNIGLKQVYIQFRDIDGSLSPVYKDSIQVLPFDPQGAGAGFYINGGATTTPVREVSLTLEPPSGAVAFRLSEGIPPIQNLGWRAITSLNEVYVLDSNGGASTLFMEYQDMDGQKSYTYEHTILYDPFSLDPGSFMINTAVPGFSDEPTLFLDILPPLGAVEMRIISYLGGYGNLGIWLNADDQAMITLDSVGTNTIAVSFRNIDGDESPFITQTIIYDPFPPSSGSFTINNGDANTTDENVELDIDLPNSANQMTITTTPMAPGPWLAASNSANFGLPSADGTYTVYIQYKTIDGHISPVYTEQIILDIP